jgi:integrase
MGRHQVSTTSERIAQRRRGSVRYIVGLPTAVDDTLLGDYLTKEWLPAIRTEVEPTTYSYLEATIRLYINPALGDLPVSGIDRDMLRSFYRELLRTPLKRRSGFLSKQTVVKVHATLSWAFQTLLESKRLPSNPAWGVRPRVAKSERYRPTIWSPPQLLEFLDAVKDDELFALWNTLALTGMRRGEALGLQWGDFSQDLKFVAVRRAWCQNGTSRYMTTPKAASSRRINLLPQTATALRRHRRRQQRARTASGLKAVKPQDHVFTRSDGDLFSPAWVTTRFIRLTKDADLTRIRLHDLRHTHASHLLEAGANYKAVQERLGHADPVFTIDTYVHLMPTIQAEGVKSLAKFYRDLRKTET